MKIATWNVNGIRKRLPEVLAWVARDAPDVFCLQEIKAAPEQIDEVLTLLPEYASYWHGAAGGYSGVSLHVRKAAFPEPPRFSHPAFDSETRIVQCSIVHDGAPLVVASLYMPNGGKDYPAKVAFMMEMVGYTAAVQAAGGRLVLCGDMNVARADLDVHPSQRKPIIGQLPEERALFEAMIGNGLVDVGRALDPDNDRLFTWWPYWREARKRNLGWRLDYVFASASLATTATACVARTEIGTSDHCPVLATFGASGG
ncbi:MAG: exodeoxyribonuclease III [Polyangiales bacterium]